MQISNKPEPEWEGAWLLESAKVTGWNPKAALSREVAFVTRCGDGLEEGESDNPPEAGVMSRLVLATEIRS